MTPSPNGPDWGHALVPHRANGCITTEPTPQLTPELNLTPAPELNLALAPELNLALAPELNLALASELNPYLARPEANRVLLVEDNEINRQLMGDFLAYHGYQVEMVGSGKDFFSVFEQFGPHVVLMDLRLPDWDGYDLLEQIQAHPVWQQVPVIIVSACALQRDQYRALALGARRYLVKPIRLTFLLEVLTAELQAPKAVDGSPNEVRVA
jgi:CheY-like chemotaxis protein